MSFSNFKNEDNKVALAMDLKNEKRNQNLVEGNKIIAEFMGGLMPFASRDMYGKETGTRYIEIEKVKRGFEDLRVSYHTSWDLQIKVFSKVIKLLRPIVMKHDELSHPDIEWFFKIKRQYLSAIEEENPLQGQEILVEAINWYNQNKK